MRQLVQLINFGPALLDSAASDTQQRSPREPVSQAATRLAAAAAVPVKGYEELDGAEGREIFFRPHRYSAEELAPLKALVWLILPVGRRECALKDVSQSGIAVEWPPDLPAALHQRVEIAVRFDEHEAFRGGARLSSLRDQDGASLVGLSFQDFLLDLDEILDLRAVKRWNRSRSEPRQGEAPLPGGERFKSLVAECRLHFEDAQRELEGLERELPWHVLQQPRHPARLALMQSLRTGFVARTVQLGEEIDLAIREIEGGHANSVAKQWSRRHLHDFLMRSHGLHRAYHKPFGYPGDYQLMGLIYDYAFEGADLFGRAVGLSFAYTVASRAVRYRKDLVKRQIAACLERRGGAGRPARVLSIAAGPAQELFELFRDNDELAGELEVVLFDQDKNALAHAWRRLHPLVLSRFPGRIRLTFLHDSIKRLLRDPTIFSSFEPFDLIYSCGLYDYLAERTAVILTRNLALNLAPEGQLLVANMVDHRSRWLMEQQLDWDLLYRTRPGLLDLGSQAVPGSVLRILEEESGANPFLQIVRG